MWAKKECGGGEPRKKTTTAAGREEINLKNNKIKILKNSNSITRVLNYQE